MNDGRRPGIRPGRRHRRRHGWLVAAVLVLCGCTPTVPDPVAHPATGAGGSVRPVARATAIGAPVSDLPPSGILAMGHSGIVGYLTADGTFRGPENSWATGTNPAVDSIATRLREVEPAAADPVANVAVPGATAAMLAAQFLPGFNAVPAPRLVLLQIVGNDAVCGPDQATEDERVERFGRSVESTINNIVTTSARTRVVAVGSLGTATQRQEVLATDPAAVAAISGTGECDLFGPDGTSAPDHATRLDALTQRFDDELIRACALHPHCHTDDGILATHRFRLDELEPADWTHLNPDGQRAVADLLWPVVQQTLAD